MKGRYSEMVTSFNIGEERTPVLTIYDTTLFPFGVQALRRPPVECRRVCIRGEC